MKVLFLTPQPPYPLDQGTKLRNYHLIRIAAQAGHQVHLLTFSTEARLQEPELERWCSRIIAVRAPAPRPTLARTRDALFSRKPDLLLRLHSGELHQALRSVQAQDTYDLVQVEGLELGEYLSAVRSPKVLDEHNAEYALQRRAYETDLSQPRRAHAAAYSFLQWRRLLSYEARICRQADAVLAVSDSEARLLSTLSGRDVVSVPNGIDLRATPQRKSRDSRNKDLLFDGTMDFRPNHDAALWFCREIFPLVRRARPDVRFWVVGRDPRPELVAQNFRPRGVAVTGAVPSLEPYWERAAVYVLPMRMGAGVRFKALQAMARGVPIVSTGLGMQGIGAEPGRDYLRAESAAEFAAAALRLLAEPELRAQLAERARRTVQAYDWSVIAPKLLAVYDRLACSRSASK